jgi:hypothetical protein
MSSLGAILSLFVAIAAIVVAPTIAPLIFSTVGATQLAITAAALAAAGNLVVGAAASRQAAREASRAASQQQRSDQLVSVRSATTPRRVVYGETIIGGTYAFADSKGTSNDELHLVLALCEGPIDSMLEVYIDDRPAGLASVDGSGWVQSGNFYKGDKRTAGYAQTTVDGSGNWAAGIPSGASIVAATAFFNDGPPIPVQVTYTISGTTIFGTASDYVGAIVRVDYTTDTGASFLRLRPHLGSTTEAADSVLMSAFPSKVTSAHQGRGIAYLYLTLVRDPSIYPSGVGNIKVRLRGKRLFDPRTATTVWSSNPVLALRDYMITYVGAQSSDFDWTTLAAAANDCDAQVLSAGVPAATDFGVSALTRGSSNENRFSCDGVIELTQTPQTAIDAILSSMGGSMTWSEGAWRIVAGTWTAPTITLTADDVIDYVSATPTTPRSDLYNAVRGVFVSQSDGYISVDYPPLSSSTYATADGATLWANLNLPMTRSVSTAQRLAKIHLERGRRQTTAKLRCNLRQAFNLQALDRVSVTLSRFGWSARTFMVVGWEWTAPGVIELTLRADDDAAYAWDYTLTQSFPPPTASTLPNPWLRSAVAGLTVTSGALYSRRRSDGVAVQGMQVSWNAQINPIVLTGGFIEVQYKSGADTEFSQYAMQAGNSTSCVIEPVAIGSTYIVRARTVNQIGVVGEFSYVSHAVGGTNSILTGNSNNLVPNSQFLDGKDGWIENLDDPQSQLTFGVLNMSNFGLGNDWCLQGSGTIFIQEAYSRPANGVADSYWSVTDGSRAIVKPGERFEASCAMQVDSCSAQLYVSFYDTSGLFCAGIFVDTKNAQDGWPLRNLAGWGRRVGGFFTVPQPSACVSGRTPAKAMIFLNKTGNATGAQYSYVWATMFYLGRASATQTDLSPWADGPVYDVSTGLIVPNAATEVYTSGAISDYSFPVGIGQGGSVTLYTLPTIYASTDSIISVTASATCSAYFIFLNNSIFGDQDVSVTLRCRRVGSGQSSSVARQDIIACSPAVTYDWVKNTVSMQIQGQLVAGESYQVTIVGNRSNWDGSKYLSCNFSKVDLRAEVIKR